MKKLFQIFWSFFQIGAFTFGGGYAMIPLIQREAVDKRGWVKEEDILDIIAIAESTPGPIAINAATFVGYRAAGVLGSVFATLGVVIPSFVVILTISFVLRQFQQIKAVQYAFWGIRAGVLALILKAMISMFKQNKKNWITFTIMGLAFVAAMLGVHVLIIVVSCAVLGLVTYKERRQAV